MGLLQNTCWALLSLNRNGAPFLWNGCAVLAEYAFARNSFHIIAVYTHFLNFNNIFSTHFPILFPFIFSIFFISYPSLISSKSFSESSHNSISRPLNLYFNNLLIRSSQGLALLLVQKSDITITLTGPLWSSTSWIFFSWFFCLFSNILLYCFVCNITNCSYIISSCPECFIPFTLQFVMPIIYHQCAFSL